jgi:hypothetical protein
MSINNINENTNGELTHNSFTDELKRLQQSGGFKGLTREDAEELIRRLLSIATVAPTHVRQFDFDVEDDSEPRMEFYRKVGEPDKLYSKNNGREIELVSESAFILESGDDSFFCQTSGLKEGNDCTRLIKECLFSGGDSISKCKAIFMDKAFWDIVAADIKIQNPIPVVGILERFGFKKFTDDKHLVKFQDENEWINHLTEISTGGPSITKSEVESIARNGKLMHYLRLAVSKINSNPGILNPSYTGPAETCDDDETHFKHLRLSKLGILPRKKYTISTISRLSDTIKRDNARLRLRFNLGIPVGYAGSVASLYPTVFGAPFAGFGPGPMRGGGIEQQGGRSILDDYQSTNKIYRDSFKLLNESITSAGKKIDPFDFAKIEKALDKHRTHETNLEKVIKAIEAYVTIGAVFEGSNVLTIDDLLTLTNKGTRTTDKISSVNDGVLSMLKQLQDILSK